MSGAPTLSGLQCVSKRLLGVEQADIAASYRARSALRDIPAIQEYFSIGPRLAEGELMHGKKAGKKE